MLFFTLLPSISQGVPKRGNNKIKFLYITGNQSVSSIFCTGKMDIVTLLYHHLLRVPL